MRKIFVLMWIGVSFTTAQLVVNEVSYTDTAPYIEVSRDFKKINALPHGMHDENLGNFGVAILEFKKNLAKTIIEAQSFSVRLAISLKGMHGNQKLCKVC